MILGFTKSKVDPNLYYKVEDSGPVILISYVDDLFLLIRDEKLITQCKRMLASEFEIKDLGMMHHFLGLELWEKPNEIFLYQGKYAVEIRSMPTLMVTNLKLLSDTYLEIVDVTMYRNMIGSLMYLTNTRPDIFFTVNT
jgi:hypothetical protein